MNSTSAIGIASSFVLFMPVILILTLKLFTNKSFLALAVYCFIMSVQTLMNQNAIVTPKWIYQSLGIANDLLDAPLMLLFLLFFSVSARMTKRITIMIFAFLVFEAAVVIFFGFTIKTVKIILAPDMAVILVLSFMFFNRNVRLAITNSKSLGKAIMISSVLLSYTIFSIAYIFFYILPSRQYRDDAMLISYLVTILSGLLMTIGILIENKRIKKLDELKNTRKELATIYGEKKVAALKKDSRFLSIM
jgi:hypothetical protein